MVDNPVTNTVKQSSPKMGCGAFIAFCIIAFVLLGVGLNQAAGYYYEHCSDEDIFECFLGKKEEPEHIGVTAKETYTYKDYAANFTFYIPLEGGDVTGNIDGVCDGIVKGSYNGQENGMISGQMTGYCDPFFVKIPAKGSFNGTVQKDAKKVPLFIKGSGGGLNKEDSLMLTF